MNKTIFIGESGFNTRKCEFKGKDNGETVRILQFSDVHINYTDELDMDNDEIMYTAQCRHWNAGGYALKPLKRIVEYAKNFDQTVIAGDILDYQTYGARALVEKYIWDQIPECLAPLGGHDITRQMQTGKPDELPIEERRDFIRKAWKHDIFYASKVLKDKVLVIALHNGEHKYHRCQIEKLENDIKMARENDYIILVFQHEPISTGKQEDTAVKALRIYDGELCNFYDAPIGDFEKSDETTRTVYNMLVQNADVIKGFFCGHIHSCYYTEVCGSYKDKMGNEHNVLIPQINTVPIVYDERQGNVLEITVK